MKFFYITLSIITFSLRVFAQAGELDNTFSGDGKLTTGFGESASGTAVAIQSDGKIIVAGQVHFTANDDFALMRYNSNATLDVSFSTDGKVNTDFYNSSDDVSDVIIQPDGKILAAGWARSSNFDFALARYNSDGSLDNTFSSDGKVTTSVSSGEDYANAVTIQTDGKIVLAGIIGEAWNYEIALVRYNDDGTLDSNFGTNGIVITSIHGIDDIASSVAIQSDEKIVVAGTSDNGDNRNFALIRYNIDGTLDASFGSGGIVTTSIDISVQGTSVKIKPDGKIIVGGYAYNGHENFALAQYNIDGSLDSSFGIEGVVTTNIVTANDDVLTSIAIQPDEKIVASGYSFDDGFHSDFALARYNADGTLDTSFSDDGKIITSFTDDAYGKAMAIGPDGKILVAGHMFVNNDGSYFALARYLSGLAIGIADFSFSQFSPFVYPNPVQETEIFKYTLLQDEVLTLRLYDINGIVKKTFFMNEARTSGEHKEELNFGNLELGSYILTLSNSTQKVSMKVVRQ